jgi:hypothetical protein
VVLACARCLRSVGTSRIKKYVSSLLERRPPVGAVNLDQASPKETTLQHLEPEPGETAGGLAETVEYIAACR